VISGSDVSQAAAPAIKRQSGACSSPRSTTCAASSAKRTPSIAARWIDEHPEYHADLADVQAALAAQYTVEAGRTNPFLHLSMHLTITEQMSIDQPAGIRQAVELLSARLGSMHAAQHAAMECLGEMVWASQRSGQPPDGHAYLDCVRRRATQVAK
jgi:Domain of unknown function (DUF1841)